MDDRVQTLEDQMRGVVERNRELSSQVQVLQGLCNMLIAQAQVAATAAAAAQQQQQQLRLPHTPLPHSSPHSPEQDSKHRTPRKSRADAAAAVPPPSGGGGGGGAAVFDRESKAPGEALQRATSRTSRTPSRPPDHTRQPSESVGGTDGGERRQPPPLPLVFDRRGKTLPPPVERRKRPHHPDDVVALKEALAEREAAAGEVKSVVGGGGGGGGGMIPTMWRPPDNVWQPYVATFVGGGGADLDDVGGPPPRKTQRIEAFADAREWAACVARYLVFNALTRLQLETMPPETLACVVKGLCRLNDANLNHIFSSIQSRVSQSQHASSSQQATGVGDSQAASSQQAPHFPHYSLVTYLHSILLQLMWHSAEGVADTLEVAYRILKRHQALDVAGQAEMLQASARLASLSPEESEIAYGNSCPPYNLAHAAKRVQVLAKKVHGLLKVKIG